MAAQIMTHTFGTSACRCFSRCLSTDKASITTSSALSRANTNGGSSWSRPAGGWRKAARSCERARILARTSGERPAASHGSMTAPC
eukprot:scaffold102283_cov26-Tisochrysis_lutea.AAC.1